MNLYSEMTDDELNAEIATYKTALRTLDLEGVVSSAAGEGRRIEYTRSNRKDLVNALREMIAEASSRGLASGGDAHNAIAVEF